MKKRTISFDKSPWKGFALIGLVSTILLAACGDDGSTSGGDDVVKINDKTISGVSQKGPFVNGSSVTVQELDGETLAQTGASYEGKIKNDMGEFSVKVAKLASQYALLKANGFYRNEVTGEKSKSQVTLYALTDLSDRDEVNVNLLTHLEYERSVYLASEGLSVGEAKKQAENEVLGSFGIEGDFANSEDLDIFGAGDGNAALLAVSVLMQGDLSEADFSERLANYAADIEEDGVWDDFITATAIADWAAIKSLNGELASIRSNIVGWGLSEDVPAFEKYVDNYWWKIYALEGCNKDREGEVKAAENSLSGSNGVHFICTEGAWKIATEIEKDTATWGAGKFDGEVRAGQVDSSLYYIYEKEKKAWRKATTNEMDTYDFENNKDWADGKDGEIKDGSITKNVYVFDSTAWRVASNVETALGGCNAAIADSIGKAGEDYYICNPRSWKKATELQYDTYRHKCSEFGQITHGNINNDYVYFCYGKAWKRLYGNESVKYGKLVDERDGQIYRIVEIGNQTWMAENLNYVDSVKYPSKICSASDQNCIKERDVYGVSYTWSEAIDSANWAKQGLKCGYAEGLCPLPLKVQGVCPDGWHVPNKDEWDVLDSVTSRNIEALLPNYIPCEQGVDWDHDAFNEKIKRNTDEYGFSMLFSQCDEKLGAWSRFWSSTHKKREDFDITRYDVETKAYAWSYGWDRRAGATLVHPMDYEYMDYSFPVRCIKGKGYTTTALEYNTEGYECTKDGKIVSGKVDSTAKYVCDDGKFRDVNRLEYVADAACTSYNRDTFYVLPRIIEYSYEHREGEDYKTDSNIVENYSYYKCTEEGWSFTTEKLNQGTMVDERDGHEYRTIGIGSQMWMAENLNYADSINYPSMLARNWCMDDVDSCAKYGRYYSWSAAVDSVYWAEKGTICGYVDRKCDLPNRVKGICPEGWHFPNDTEWDDFLSWTTEKSNNESFGWENDRFGFSALPAGRIEDGNFSGVGEVAYFWSNISHDGTGMMGSLSMISRARDFSSSDKRNGLSVRCVKDEEE